MVLIQQFDNEGTESCIDIKFIDYCMLISGNLVQTNEQILTPVLENTFFNKKASLASYKIKAPSSA